MKQRVRLDRFARLSILFACLTAVMLLISLETGAGRRVHPGRTLFLMAFAAIVGWGIVRLRNGRLTLLAIPLLTALVTVTPAETILVGMAGNVGRALRGRRERWHVFTGSALWSTTGSLVNAALIDRLPSVAAHTTAIAVALTLNIVANSLHVAAHRGERVQTIWRSTINRPFLLTYIYFFLAGLLSVSLLDGSTLGYLRVAALYLLSFALLLAVSERVTGDALREQLQVIDERIVFGQEAEAALHAVKNQLALASQYLEDISPAQLGREEQEALRIVFNSMQQSSDILRRTSAAGRVANAPAFVDANLVELAHSVVVLAQARASQSNVRVNLVTKEREVLVYVDPFLIREVLTNLLNNSLEALAGSGHVQVIVGVRPDGSPYAQVVDDGPGLSEEAKRSIFTTRHSTKTTSGAGIGLMLSHAIAIQHGGKLSYSRARRNGASFLLTLPTLDAGRARLAAHSRMASGRPQTRRSHPEVALLPGS